MKDQAARATLGVTAIVSRYWRGRDAPTRRLRTAQPTKTVEPVRNGTHDDSGSSTGRAKPPPLTPRRFEAPGSPMVGRLLTLHPAVLVAGSLVLSTLVGLVAAGSGSPSLYDEASTAPLITAALAAGCASLSMAGVVIVLLRELYRSRSVLLESEEWVRQIAHFDPLTGLPNRVLLKDRITNGLAAAHRNGQALALLFIDLDRFKSINDTRGHHVGDELLLRVAQRLARLVRDVDTVSRLGGDEFVLVLPNTGADGAAEVAEKIRSALAEPVQIAHASLSVTPSIGISLYPDDGTDMDALLRSADAAMYHAKSGGRNVHRFFRGD